MPRTSLFNFFDRFRTGFIGDAKRAPRYSDDIQLVSIVQDISGVTPAGGGGDGWFARVRVGGDRQAAIAGANVATVELECVVDSWVIYGEQITAGEPEYSADLVPALAGHAAPSFDPSTVSSRIAYGSAPLNPNSVAIPSTEHNELFMMQAGGFAMPAGTFFRMQGGVVGINTDYILFWRELIP